MTKRIKYLLLLNIVLLALISFALQRTQKSSTLDRMATAFAVKDTAQLGAVRIGKLVLRQEQNRAWSVNKEYLASPERIDKLLEMLPRLEIKNPAPKNIREELLKAFDEKGFLLEAYSADGLMKQYPLVSFQGQAYAMLEEKKPYALYVPGYRENVADWLGANSVQTWRDKHVLYATWRTLKDLKIEVPERPEQNLQITFEEDFYRVKGVQRLDSLKLYNYVSQYVRFQAEQYLDLPGNHPTFEPEPAVIITVEDLSRQFPAVMELYPRNDSLYGWLPETQEAVLLNPKEMAGILQPPAAFEQKPK